MRRFYGAMAAIGVAAGIGGYFLGRSGEKARGGSLAGGAAMEKGWRVPGEARDGGRPGGFRPGGRGAEPLTAEQREGLKERLLRSYRYTGSPGHDWMLKEETGRVLAAFSNQELEEFAREIAERVGFVEAQYRRRRESDDRDLVLLNEIFAQWGLRDPAAACLAMSVLPIDRTRIFEDWLKRDPEAAEAWIRGGDVPPGSERQAEMLRQSYLLQRAEKDLPGAGRELAALDQKAKGRVLSDWGRRFANQPEKRAELLVLIDGLGDEGTARDCRKVILESMALKSLPEAFDFLEGLDVPDEEAAALNDVAMGKWAQQEPEEAFAAWAESGPESVPESMVRALSDWSLNSPGAEQAVEWVKGLEAGPVRDELATKLVNQLTWGGRWGMAGEVAAEMRLSPERTRILKTVRKRWREVQPEAAAEWMAGLPAEVREEIEAPLE